MTMPGPGDPETWGPPTGHPHDPRTPDPEDCPVCGEPVIDPNGCPDCGWEPPEPDYESMADPDLDAAGAWAEEVGGW